MQFFSLDGFDSQSNVLLVFHICECVNVLGEWVNARMHLCHFAWKTKHVLDCTRWSYPSLSVIPFLSSSSSCVLSDILPVVLQSIFSYLLIPGMIARAC